MNNSPEIEEELGKIVLRRFTKGDLRILPKPGTAQFQMQSMLSLKRTGLHLKKAILKFWMNNHHWLKKQKLRVNRARFRETGHQQESPSKYVIHKMELLTLVYSYTDTETIKAIMIEVPGTWASIINPQYQKMLREFQNIIKYQEESLEKLEVPVLQPPCLPNQE